MTDELAPQVADVADAGPSAEPTTQATDGPSDPGPEHRKASTRSRRSRRSAAPKTQLSEVAQESAGPLPQDLVPSPATVSATSSGPAATATDASPDTSAPASGSRSRARRSRARKTTPPSEDLADKAIPDANVAEPTTAEIEPQTEPAQTPVVKQEAQAPAPRSRRTSRGSRRGSKHDKAGSEPTVATSAGAAEASVDVSPDQETAEATKRPAKSATPRKREAKPSKSTKSALATARVAIRRGFPELVINGEEVVPSIFFGSISEEASVARVHSQMRRAAQAGVKVYSTLVELVCPMPPDDTVYQALDERIERVADFDRNAYLMPRIVFHPMPAWQTQYPGEMQSLETGPTGEPSIASEHFWAEAGRSLRLLIEHIRRTSYGARIVGYHLERGEWFQPAAGGFDRSFANREGFRRWLRAKYNDSEVALRAAWYDGSVQFFTADIPPVPTSATGVAFYDPRRERRWVDFMEYSSDVTADRILALAEAVKSATDGNALVSVSYGYVWEFLHAWSGHLSLARVLASPAIDILTGPLSYSDRAPGCPGALPVPVDSIAAHGKLWISEDDTKTHLAPASQSGDNYNPRMENAAATEAVHGRGIGTALAHQTGVAWMDLWGDGWLDSDSIWKQIGSFGEWWGTFQKTRKLQEPDVVALIDERSLCHVADGNGFAKRVIHGSRDALLRCGASVGFYLQSDVSLKSFPTGAKLYVFLNAYRISEEERNAIKERLRAPGRTLVWLYAVGSVTDRTSLDEPTPDVVGLSLRPQPWNSEIGTRIIVPGHPIVQPLDGRALGSKERLSPSYYVDDDSPGITVLGEYSQTGLPSLVVRSFEGWNSVFCGEPSLTPELLRGLCRFAGVHLHTRAPEDYVQAGNGWLSMHVLRDGQRTLAIPDGFALLDVAEGYTSSPSAREYRTPVRAKTSRLFYLGTTAAIRKLGFDPSRHRPSVAPSEAGPPKPPRPEPNVPSPAETAGLESGSDLAIAERTELVVPPVGDEPASVVAELREELTAALSLGQTPVETEASVSEQAPDQRKRRRRRGGRGRGRRKPTEGSSAEGSSGAAESP